MTDTDVHHAVSDGRRTFDHVILTRFNVQLDDQSAVPDDAWLARRLELFSNNALRTMSGQVVRPHAWLLFCDARSPLWFRKAIERDLPDFASVVWVDGVFSPETVSSAVAACSDAPFLLSTRLDNDDAVCPDFAALTQAGFKHQTFQFVNPTFGIQYERGRLYLRLDPSSPFVSLVEQRLPGSPPKTVFLDQHDRLQRHGRIAQQRTHPTWLQVVHGGNIANEVRGVRVDSRVLRHFDVDLPTAPIGRLTFLLDVTRTTARMGVRIVSRPHRISLLFRSLARNR